MSDRSEVATYLVTDKENPELSRAEFTVGFNMMTDEPFFGTRIMGDLSDAYRASDRPAYHLFVSFGAEDAAALTRGRMADVARELLQRMGFARHYAVLVGHADRDHSHFHLMVDLRNPDTGVLAKEPYWRTVHYACRQVEREFGLQEVPSTLAKLEGQEWPSRDEYLPLGARRARFRMLDKVNADRPKKAHRDLMADEEPFLVRARHSLQSYFKNRLPDSWVQLEDELAQLGYRLVRQPRGLAITTMDGSEGAALSSVSRYASLTKLEKHFGPTYDEHVHERSRSGTDRSRPLGRDGHATGGRSGEPGDGSGHVTPGSGSEPGGRLDRGVSATDDDGSRGNRGSGTPVDQSENRVTRRSDQEAATEFSGTAGHTARVATADAHGTGLPARHGSSKAESQEARPGRAERDSDGSLPNVGRIPGSGLGSDGRHRDVDPGDAEQPQQRGREDTGPIQGGSRQLPEGSGEHPRDVSAHGQGLRDARRGHPPHAEDGRGGVDRDHSGTGQDGRERADNGSESSLQRNSNASGERRAGRQEGGDSSGSTGKERGAGPENPGRNAEMETDPGHRSNSDGRVPDRSPDPNTIATRLDPHPATATGPAVGDVRTAEIPARERVGSRSDPEAARLGGIQPRRLRDTETDQHTDAKELTSAPGPRREDSSSNLGAESRFVVVSSQFKSDVIDLATGEKYRALSHDEATSRAHRANVMWHFRRPEEEVDNYLAAMDQRLRDKLNLPPRENADALRTLIANEISMPSMTESSYRQAELIPLELRPLPSLVARPNQDASTEQPQRANKTSEQKPVDPLASIPTPVRQQIDSYQQRLRLSAETLEAINVVQQTRAAVNTLREAEHALEASNTKFRNAMEHLYGPGRDVAIASHARLARTDSAAAADTILRKRPEAFAPVITADETSTAGRRSPTENTQVARDAAAAAGDLRHVAAAHTTTVTRIRADMQLHPSVGVDAILTHCQRRLSDAQRQHERIRVTLQKLGTNGTNTVVRNAIADLKPEQRNALVAHIPSLDQIAGQVRATQSLIEGPERDGPGL